jgi:hypothetical protein
MTVLAEGVETQETLNCLQYMGCQQVQGYLISRPLPPDQAEQFLKTRRDGSLLPDLTLQSAPSYAPVCRIPLSETRWAEEFKQLGQG